MVKSSATTLMVLSNDSSAVDAGTDELSTSADPMDFETLVVTYQDQISRLVHRLLGWSDEADDVVQEVFLAAMRQMHTFKGQSKLSTWLITIAINKVRSHIRWRAVREGARCLLARHLARPAPADPQQEAAKRELFEEVASAVRALGGKLREVVVLRYLEQLSTARAAEVLGISPSAVDVRLHRARAKLKDLLADHFEHGRGKNDPK